MKNIFIELKDKNMKLCVDSFIENKDYILSFFYRNEKNLKIEYKNRDNFNIIFYEILNDIENINKELNEIFYLKRFNLPIRDGVNNAFIWRGESSFDEEYQLYKRKRNIEKL